MTTERARGERPRIGRRGTERSRALGGRAALVASVLAVVLVAAACEPVGHRLTVRVSGDGTVVVSPEKATYQPGEVVTLTPVAAPGSAFSGWSGALGGSASPATVTMDADRTVTALFTATGPPPSGEPAFESDDFNRATLGDDWTVVDPVGDGTVVTTGAGTGDAHLELRIPAGVAHLASSPNQSLRAMRAASDDDFDLEVRFASVPGDTWSGQGALVQQDADDWLRFEVFRAGADSLRVLAGRSAGGAYEQLVNVPVPAGHHEYLRVRRVGDNWSLFTSTDAQTWTVRGNFTQVLAVSSVGAHASNFALDGPAPALTVAVDYFFERSAPIVPEDGPVDLAFQSDDFNRVQLGPLWQVVDPVGDGTVATIGAGSGDAHLQLAVPAGPSHNAWMPNESLRVLQSASDLDFDLEAKFASTPSADWTSHGVLVQQDASNWLRFDVYAAGGTLRAFSGRTVGGVASQITDAGVPASHAAYLRVQRAGDQWTFSTSADGGTWTTRASFTQALTVSAIGPFAGNYAAGGPSVAYTAAVDYVFERSAPIVPEDGSPVPTYTLTTPVSGPGAIARTPDKVSYLEGETVTLTAIPQPGHVLSGWTGHASGTANPIQVVMAADRTVGATFVVAPADQDPPVISGVSVSTTSTSATVSWTTDEPATSSVVYGTTAAYGSGPVGDAVLKTQHQVTLPGLSPATTYHYRITSTDAAQNAASTADATFTTGGATPGGPTITLFYGDQQTFGALGRPNTWVNLLGNVSDPDGVASISARVNGGTPKPMSIGPDLRRLSSPGDFVVEIGWNELNPGANQVVITAQDGAGNQSTKTVVVNYVAGQTWALPTSTNWAQASSVQDVVQVVDGRWKLQSGKLRTDQVGYDRIVTLGDLTWTDYEVVAPFTIHSWDPAGFQNFSVGPAFGFLLRWRGHVAADLSQPAWFWYPMGALAYHQWTPAAGGGTDQRLNLVGNNDSPALATPSSLPLGVEHRLKARVQTVGSNTVYSVKLWRASDPEPAGWTLSTTIGHGPASGSLGLFAHHVDVSIGTVTVTPLAP